MSTPIPPINQNIAESQGKFGFGKIVAAFLSAAISSYLMNQFSLHGVNFEADNVIPGIKMSSEFVKSTLDATLITCFVWLTPKHFVAAIKDLIIGLRCTLRTWKSAFTDDLPPQQ